jgi:DNA-directed RNA polymerase specialized sigma24 family protein
MLARNRALDARRRKRLTVVPLDVCDDMGDVAPGTPPKEEWIAEMQVHFPEEMELVRARSEGYTWEEISRVVGVSSGALRLRWHRFVQHIKESGRVA